ncbi:phage baseplate assembly protein V [Chryseobacterium sp. 09-1422]|jgi:type VI secretion system secreted protein VgrG|uniref:Phage baseplate assembly protein V n=1 Tax=Chryseobacterium kimseyorum TaxID=2984028 RepID=A0ABT3HT34_9FLAO|nr:phage baseplate assembly protein V [Chryseobacterium kimseyorum]MCW3166941.1 phage baseplate assembly protein V [Chryseobacterium kimseyorum]
MFKDNKSTKLETPKNVKNSTAVQNLTETATSQVVSQANSQLQSAGGKVQKLSQKVSKIQSTATTAQSMSGMFMNQNLQSNNPLTTEGKVWAKQPTSNIHNAAAIAGNQVFGINRVVKLDVVIEGKTIQHFKHFHLRQSALKHHQFSLTLAHDTLGDTENHNLEQAQNFLGKRLTVIFKYKDVTEGPERNFVGVITEVGFSQDKGSLGNIVLTGFSPTVLLDAAPHIQSFGGAQEISLNSIADHVMKEGLGGSKFDFRVDAQYGNVTYSSQYEETHYNYLARIAEAYGEQFFYDGEVLHFGKLPPQEKPVKLTYGSSVSDIKITMKAQHVNPTFYGYNSSKDEKLTAGSSKINHTSDIAKRAYEISEKTFTTPSLRIAPIKAASFMDVETSQKGTAGSKASDVFVTSGNTTVPFLYPGCIADIEMRKADSSETSYFTKLLITDVTHEVDAKGFYTGSFEAIAADSGYIPRPEFEVPRADAQFAKVISNTDPLNQGRVQVQFDWQNGSTTTEYIRVMTPDGGGSEKVSKNRGFMAIPEVGDQVVVNFAHQHPDRPFVMGGMFHGGVGGGGGAGNNVKSLSSKSGHTVSLDDGGGMTLRDKDQNTVFLDGAGNISVDSKVTISLTCGNSQIFMDKDGNINIKGKEIFVQGDNIGVAGTASVGIGVGPEGGDPTSGIGIEPTTLDVGTKTLSLGGTTEANLSSAKINIGGGEETNIVSGTVKLN